MCNLRFSKGVIFFICFSLSQGKIIMERSRGRGGLNRNCELVVVVDLLFLLPGEFYTPISSNSQTVPQVRSKGYVWGCTYPFVQFMDLHT
jgi:hypothetical protein